ncbi:complex I NDUFA9 subunit family protein [Candidatus Halobonum tyrrellensis]|uniref:NADH dehydrogenase/oxidoreductase-like protein n=1 Tax=Candidatus Halobonum tyrrellensis G22 TaxID=1324957 RepID=V4HCL1_9EURY|nr:complex I NDUFA9 subunit family protein [Candidatus Halobonum tyrrellensis]ESP88430.1 NADH dehydrogenase/oxidoreductase-like protein [Candidatus Halobonum tyrrellensis G22]
MQVLVAGGTGFVGSYLCRELADRGHSVVAMSSSPDASAPDGVETVMGDVTAYDSVAGHVADADAVVNLVALSPLMKPDGGDEMHEEVHLGGTENLLRAAEEGGVDRFVQMSALGADPDGPTHYIRAKGAAEEAVRGADLEWVIYRPSIIFGEGSEILTFPKKLKKMVAPAVPVYPLPGGGKTPFQLIWIGDLAPMLADGVDDDDRAGETYELGGPEVLTLREVTEKVYAAEGKSVRTVPLPMGLARVGLTTLGAVGFPMGPDQYRSLKLDNTVRDNDVAAFGVSEAELKTFDEFLGLTGAGDDPTTAAA